MPSTKLHKPLPKLRHREVSLNLDREVRHNCENVDDKVLADVLVALQKRVKISHDFDIPYIAGYSGDATTVCIDRHLPRTMAWKGREVRLASRTKSWKRRC